MGILYYYTNTLLIPDIQIINILMHLNVIILKRVMSTKITTVVHAKLSDIVFLTYCTDTDNVAAVSNSTFLIYSNIT